MPKKLDFKNLRLCLDNYKAYWLYIRLKGAAGGTVKVSENLKSKTLNFKENKSNLWFFIDSKEIFHFSLQDHYYKGFALAYERFENVKGIERIICLPQGLINPYDPKFPEPKSSTLRNVIDNHLIEIAFEGRIDLKFHSWWEKPYWKYWTIDIK